MQRSRLQRQNSASDLYGLGGGLGGKPSKLGGKVGLTSHALGPTREQQALLARFGLRGVAAHNNPVIAQYFASERPGTNAYRAVRLARAMHSGMLYSGAQRGERRQRALAKAVALNAAKMVPQRQRRYAKVKYNQRLQALQPPPGKPMNAKTAKLRQQARNAYLGTAHGLKYKRRDQLRQLVGTLWEAGQQLSRIVSRSTLEQKLYRIFQARAAPAIIEGALSTTKRQTQGSAAAEQVAKVTGAFAVKGAACALGLGGLLGSGIVSWIVSTALFMAGNKAYVSIQRRWNDIVDSLVQAAARNPKAVTRATGSVINGLIAATDRLKVPQCLRVLFVANFIRTMVTDYVEKQFGVPLDVAILTEVLVKHRKEVKQFLEGNPKTKLKGLVVDLVNAIPDQYVDTAIKAMEQQYATLVRPK